eukprot:3018236-Pleurochrysis_carterae.AAC.1
MLSAIAVAITSSPLDLPWACAVYLIHSYFVAGRAILRLPPPPLFTSMWITHQPTRRWLPSTFAPVLCAPAHRAHDITLHYSRAAMHQAT